MAVTATPTPDQTTTDQLRQVSDLLSSVAEGKAAPDAAIAGIAAVTRHPDAGALIEAVDPS